MNERFMVTEIHICPVYKSDVAFKVDLDYPTRFCVIDNAREIAIDIKTKLKYDYIKTMSHLYFISQSYKKIKDNKRVAILPYADIYFDKYDIKEVQNIILRLKNNEEFQDGNEVYDNKAYLEYLKDEAIKENKKNKTKKIRKRRK